MKPAHYLQEEELIKNAIDALMKKLGPIETSRFLTLPKSKRIESTRRHRQWQNNLDAEKFLNEIFAAEQIVKD